MRSQSLVYTPSGDDEDPRPFHVGGPPPPVSSTVATETVQLITHRLVLSGHIQLMEKYYKNVNWSSYDLPKVLKDRGVDDPEKLPGFYYRDDALRLWNAIKDYIKRVLSIYYHSDEDIEKVKCSFVVVV